MAESTIIQNANAAVGDTGNFTHTPGQYIAGGTISHWLPWAMAAYDFSSSASSNTDAALNALTQNFNNYLTHEVQFGKENREYNAIEAQKLRDWQEMMSNTSYQRAMADMKAAGLNPILAYQNGGASVPGGSAASYGTGAGIKTTDLTGQLSDLLQSASDKLFADKTKNKNGFVMKLISLLIDAVV